ATDALAAADAAQRGLHIEPWGETGPLRVRIGLHTGAVETRDGDYQSSLTLIRAQRFMAAGHGGQNLLSLSPQELLHDHLPRGVSLRDLGTHRLKGLARPERIFQLVIADLPTDFPPLRALAPADAQDETALLGRITRGRLVGRAEPIRRLVERLDKLKS